ncbi:MAG: hypothetical protein LBT09_05490 [Planctomycetaceae bacterium]|jgi:hypothetical protein|nr:hypothetical protein [Planctomycetaceae bacterium]
MSNNTQQHNNHNQPNNQNPNPQITIELDEIRKLFQSRQVNAALARIEEAQRKFPDNLEIIAMKLRVFRATGNTQLALDIARSILNESPNAPIAISEYILSNVANGNLKEAVDSLIDFCESSHDELNPLIIGTILELAYYLLIQGAVSTATALAYRLRQFEAIADKADSIIYSATSAAEVPLLIREFSFDYNCPENFPAKNEFTHATVLLSQMRWKEALQSLKSIANHATEWTNLLRNIAVLQYWLIEPAAACDTLKSYAASPNITAEDAADIEALRLTINPNLLGEPDYMLHAEYKITDANAALEKLLSSSQMFPIPFDQRTFVQQNQVPPKGIFKVLNRPLPPPEVELTTDNISSHIAICFLFGKETDRDARIEIADLPKNELKLLEITLKQVLGDLFVTNLSKTETAKSQARAYDLAIPRFLFAPNRTYTLEQQKKLIEQYLINTFASQWLQTTFESLGNKTPADAAKEPTYKIRVLGLLSLLEHDVLDMYGEIATNVINYLRKILGYPLLDTIQIQGTTDEEQLMFISSIPVWRWYRLDIKNLSDRTLAEGFQLVNLLNESRCSQNFAEELLSRPLTSADSQSRMFAYDRLIKIKRQNNELEDALKLIDKAKNESVLANSTDAIWYMHEIPIRLVLNQIKHVEEAIAYILRRYSNNENVMKELNTLLTQLGLVRPNDKDAVAESDLAGEGKLPPVAPQQKKAELWTPDNNTQQEQTKSKLWTPD